MMSPSPISGGASGAAGYYLKEETDLHLTDVTFTLAQPATEKANSPAVDYYLSEKDSTDKTQWVGRIAEKEGIAGRAVTDDKLQAVLNGNLEHNSVKGANTESRRTGYDLTFSAPKGASILALAFGDTRIVEAHHNAVKAVLSEIEKDTAQVRTIDASARKDGFKADFENTGNLLFATVQHKTSREDEPQLHTHALMANMTYDKEGNLKNLASQRIQDGFERHGSYERILDNQKYYSAQYHSLIGREFEKMGYNIQSLGNGQIDIADVPQSIIDDNSTRRQQILSYAEKSGMDSSKARDIAAQTTRKAKTHTPESSLLQQWQAKNTASGFDGAALIHASYNETLRKEAPVITVTPETTQALNMALAHLSNNTTHLRYEQVLTIASNDFSYGKHLDISLLKGALDEKIKDGELIPLTDSQSVFTTQALLDKEQALIDATQGRKKSLSTTIDKTSLKQLTLNKDSEKAVTQVLNSKKLINVVNVSGHSQQLDRALLHVGSESNKRVRFITPDNITTSETASQVKRQSFTTMQWIKNTVRDNHIHSVAHFINQPQRLNTNDLLIVEQANKLGADQTQSLIEKAKETGSKIVFLNHTKSRGSYKAGNAMETLKRGNVQSIDWQGTPISQAHVSIKEDSNTQHREQQLIERYSALSPQQRTSTQLLVTNKAEANALNNALHRHLDKTGQLGEQRLILNTLTSVFMTPEQRATAGQFKPGMVITEFSDKRPHVVEVTDVDKKANTLTVKDARGKTVHWTMNSPAIKNKSFYVAQPNTVEVANGERLKTTGTLFGTPLTANQSMTVERVHQGGLLVRTDNNQVISLSHKQLHHSPLNYGYVSHVNQRELDKKETIVSIKSYKASEGLLNDLLNSRTDRLDILTDDKGKLASKLAKTHVKPSAIYSVMHTAGAADKFINRSTTAHVTQDVNAAIHAIGVAHIEKPLINQAVAFALSHVGEKKAAFKHAELVTSAIEFAMKEQGTIVTKQEIDTNLENLKQDGSVLSVQYSDGTRWTTKGALETEQRILMRFENGKNALAPLVEDKSQVTQFLADKSRNTQGQSQAIEHIVTSKDRFIAIQGFAGTGKSTMLEQGIELTQQANVMMNKNGNPNLPISFMGLAPTHAAVNELKEKGVEGQTIQSLLRDIETNTIEPERFKNTVFLVDETSMTANDQIDRFTAFVEQTGARAILLGDISQLQSQSAGKPFELGIRQDKLNTTIMKDIVRQQSDGALSAVKHIINQSPESTLAALKAQDTLPDTAYIEPNVQSINRSEHVISTYEPVSGNRPKDNELAKEKLYASAAKEYLDRTPEAQNNTLVIAYSNRERDMLTRMIRQGLIKTRSIGSENSLITRLKAIPLTRPQMKHISSYQQGDILTQGHDRYHSITAVDKVHGFITLADMRTGEESHFFPAKHEHQQTGLWASSTQPLSRGDKIMWRQTDKERDLTGNEPLTVTHIDPTHLTVISEKTGKGHTFDKNDIASSHWDYRYTRTADMAQGATFENVITVIQSSAKLTNIRRAYIDISRASHHIKLFTDNTQKTMLSWLNHEKDTPSAIETLNKTRYDKERHFDINTVPADNPKYHINGQFSFTQYSKDIATQLTPYTESLAVDILGKPNKSKSTNDYLSFGQGKNLTKVSLTGEYRGYYKNWETGERGNLINLIMNEKDISFKDAVQHAGILLSEPDKHHLTANKDHNTLMKTETEQTSKLKAHAIRYFNEAKPLDNTIASTYLAKQNIHPPHNDNLRYHDAVYSSETKRTHPALIAKYQDNEQQLQAVEITYLNNEGEKENLRTPKRILGNKSSHFIHLRDGDNYFNSTIVAIGTENALSINDTVGGNMTILSTDNINNLKTLNKHDTSQDIILVPDKEINENTLNDIITTLNDNNLQVVVTDKDNINTVIQDINNQYDTKDNDDIHHHALDDNSHDNNKKDDIDKIHQSDELNNKDYDLSSSHEKDKSIDKSLELDNDLSI